MQVTALFILEIINIAIAILFLIFFAIRLKHLQHFAQTENHIKSYPKLRIFFAIIYIIISIALLTYNIVSHFYLTNGSEYLFAGGGGELINSLILVLQLFVLKRELQKQRPYTGTHLVYFCYLIIISIVRFCLTLIGFINERSQNEQINLILATCLMLDSTIQVGYWIAKKQQLPQFQNNDYLNFDQFKNQSSRQFANRFQTNKISNKSGEDDFPYIKSTVKIQKSRFKIILQVLVSNTILPSDLDNTLEVKKQGNNMLSFARQSYTKNTSNKSTHFQIVSEHLYSLQQLKELYLLCGRFPLKRQLHFLQMNVRQLAQNLQLFLDQLFQERRNYQTFLLKFLHINQENVKMYAEKNKDYSELQLSDKEEFGGKTSQDKNAIYVSIQVYRQLWIEDHYEFYMKVITKQNTEFVYPMRRYSEFQDLDSRIKSLLAGNKIGHFYQLPSLPKKHLFYWDQSKINHRRNQLEVYLRKLCNDYTLMEVPAVSQTILKFLNLYNHVMNISPTYEIETYEEVKITKGSISKALVNNDYVTFYEFKLFRHGIQTRTINKRFNDFVNLHEDFCRWMNNIQIQYKSIVLPEKHLYKSEIHRQQKLRVYLQNIIDIKDIYKVYCINSFFNILGSDQLSDDTFFSAISMIKSKSHLKQSDKNPSNSNKQFEMSQSPSLSFSSNQRMSALIDQLGNGDSFD